MHCRLVTLALGQAAGRFLQYEAGAPTVYCSTNNPSDARFAACTRFCRLVTLASGQAAGRFLQYEAGAPTVAAQTAYGIEADVEGYNDAYDSSSMLFMDYRRHHSGLWDGAARHLEPGVC
jgi:hypothetical protein